LHLQKSKCDSRCQKNQGHSKFLCSAAVPAGYVPGRGRGAGGASAPAASGSGSSSGLFGDHAGEADDDEADSIYKDVDDQMAGRRRKRRRGHGEAAHDTSQQDAQASQRSRIADQFADLKAGLKHVGEWEWESLPDAADGSLRGKARRQDQFVPVPDTVIQSAAGRTAGQFASSEQSAGDTTSMSGLSQARGQVLALQLDKRSDSVSGQTVIDPAGYLTSLDSSKGYSEAEIGDVKKAKALMQNMVASNPGNPLAWINAARFTAEVERKLTAARNIITRACEACPRSEDVWLEACRLASAADSPAVLAAAVRHIPSSVKVWMKAAQLESEVSKKKAMLRKALEVIPGSVKLWKAAIELEEPEDARVLLTQAVEEVPGSAELWISLAQLESYAEAQSVLNTAHTKLPGEPLLWITAAKLEEAAGHEERVPQVVGKAIRKLAKRAVIIDRSTWLQHAEDAEHAGSPVTAGALVQASLGMGVEEADQQRTWQQDAAAFARKGLVHCARAAYKCLLAAYQSDPSAWLAAAHMEKQHGDSQRMKALLKEAVQHCPQEEVLWLMAAKQEWLDGDVPAARSILKTAFECTSNSEAIWLAAVKLEWDTGNMAVAQGLLQRARQRCPTPRVWMKSAKLARRLSQVGEEERLLREAVSSFAEYDKCWLMLAQLYMRTGRSKDTKAVLHSACKACSHAAPVWLLAADVEASGGSIPKARSILEAARTQHPKNDQLWVASVELEADHGDPVLVQQLLARGLQECPKSGAVWACAVRLAKGKHAKNRMLKDALPKLENKDPLVLIEGARCFWQEGKLSTARKWLKRACGLAPDLGDAWAWLFKLESDAADEGACKQVVQDCSAAQPTHGRWWQPVAKAVGNENLACQDVLRMVCKNLPSV